jgi:hypothetical protein
MAPKVQTIISSEIHEYELAGNAPITQDSLFEKEEP